MEWLNYHHLLYFWTVAREGSIVRACDKLLVAQPTISGQIKMLGVTFRNRHPLFKEFPTLHEQSVTGYDVDLWLGVPVLDFPAKVNFEGRRVELLNRADAAFAGTQAVPKLLQIDGQRVDRTHAGDDDAARHFLASSFSM